MNIVFEKENNRFFLNTKNTTYIMEIVKNEFLAHIYWGKKIKNYFGSNKIMYRDRGFSPNIFKEDRTFSLDTLPQEYPQYGNGDFRPCAYHITDKNNNTYSDLRYKNYEILEEKPKLQGLPNSYGEKIETLVLTLLDQFIGLEVKLYYSIFYESDVIVRRTTFKSLNDDIILNKMLSANVDFRNNDFDLISLYGAHNNDRNIDRRPLTSGTYVIESTRGASSMHQSPFLILIDKEGNENQGDTYAMQFIYSGSFHSAVHIDQYKNIRMQMGLQPFDNNWILEKGKTFYTPEVVLTYSDSGLTGLSNQLHYFVRNHILRGMWKNKERPILINNWEATYFDFNEEKLLHLAEEAKNVGIELFVLDDGWFKKRNSDTSSLGDWEVDLKKLPKGIDSLADKIHSMGLKFGLWFEPEMINEDSDLYRLHPEYTIQVKDRNLIYGRGQFVLDLSNKEVCDYVIESISKILKSQKIDYIKWDMNRHITNAGSLFLNSKNQRECTHRYMLGLYYILETLTEKYPDILFESCSSGGGRFDLGLLCYMPQTWASDNTDAVCRSKIQYATSLMYPSLVIGAHVSVCPNHQVGRNTPLNSRFNIALCGNLGYELDLTLLSVEEKLEIKNQVNFYKEIRNLVQFGDYYRLLNPFTTNEYGVNFVSKTKEEILVVYLKVLSEPAAPFHILKLKGLNEDYLYMDMETENIYSGAELMYAGLSLENVKQDFYSKRWFLKKLSLQK